MNDQTIEQEIQAKGLTAPRVTPADIEANIVSSENFNAEIGRKIARQNAVQKMWTPMGYELKQRLFEGA